MAETGSPTAGLYSANDEHDSCGVGFVVDIPGRRSHALVAQALSLLRNLEHRGGSGAEPNSGDGAGLTVQIPHAFFSHPEAALDFALPELGQYATGLIFLPPDDAAAAACCALLERVVAADGLTFLGFRDPPVDPSSLGPSARSAAPRIRQAFIATAPTHTGDAFERRLFVIRRRVELAISRNPVLLGQHFHLASLSARTLVYKGMLSAGQLERFYPDLTHPAFDSALALVHQRFSTNTFPSWALAQPFRLLAHNGEINTVRGNRSWMRARRPWLTSALLPEIQELLPLINPGQSDSASFDAVLELLVLGGRSLPHALSMMVPPALGPEIDPDQRAFFDFHRSLMEPWDGPAAIAFTDGRSIGAVLDRNGLRPARWVRTRDDRFILASEAGALPIDPAEIVTSNRLRPGRLLLIDTVEGRLVSDGEIKRTLAAQAPYRDWLQSGEIPVSALPLPPRSALGPEPTLVALQQRQRLFGITEEELRLVLTPMATRGEEPVGSMGTDTPLAALSTLPRLLSDYFVQGFAQVTNPPLDAIREALVTDLSTTLGAQHNLLTQGPAHCQRLRLETPLLDAPDLARLLCAPAPHQSARLSLSIAAANPLDLEPSIQALCATADREIANGATLLVLGDGGSDATHAALPVLLGLSALHQHLVREGQRTRVSLLIDADEPRDVHQIALLIGFGADAIHPRLALDSVAALARAGVLGQVNAETARTNLLKALAKGLLKILSKMGISTVQSYRGAQVFEALGLDRALIDQHFTGTSCKLSGIGLEEIAADLLRRHAGAFQLPLPALLDAGSDYQWRREGERHLFTPEAVFQLAHASRTGQREVFSNYAAAIDTQGDPITLRSLLVPLPAATPIALSEVEPAAAILRRFSTGAMSLGSISSEAHETLALAMNRIGGRSNTGEGGEDPARFGGPTNSAVKQVASGRFGVTSNYLVSATDLQIKIAQGSKPGEGGQLPGGKVTVEIARVRHSTPGVELISPPPHHDIYSIEDLAQLIYDLKSSNPRARIHVKLTSEAGVGTVAAGCVKAHADVVLISGHDGGTGASPLSALKHAGSPWELGLAEAQQVLIQNRLRDRVSLQVDGQLRTGRDVVIAALLGAEEFGFATAPLVVMGCVMMRVCHLNTCPVGIATQDPALRRLFSGKAEFVEQYFRFVADDVREWMARLGFRTVAEMVGRSDRLAPRAGLSPKLARLDLQPLLALAPLAAGHSRHHRIDQDHGLALALDRTTFIPACTAALDHGERVEIHATVRNVDRALGTQLGYELTRRHGARGLPPGTIQLVLRGSAGQSLGAFLPAGIAITLAGEANDYVGKGLSGGSIVIYPAHTSTLIAEENVIIGNVALYGATSGELYVRGIAGERFAVRNSGARAVVEGIGDHGCEYMTGGRVAILGETGRNFAAGMSGGIAYVHDPQGKLAGRCNHDLVDLDPLDATGAADLRVLLERHHALTGSPLAARLLADFHMAVSQFVQAMPREYRRALASQSTIPTEAEVATHG